MERSRVWVLGLLLAAGSAASAPIDVPVTTGGEQVAAARAVLRRELGLLTARGKDAYLESLFARMDAEEGRLAAALADPARRASAVLGVRALESVRDPAIHSLFEALPRDGKDALRTDRLAALVTRTNRAMKARLAAMSREELAASLEATIGALGAKEAWWERFFGNSTVVRNVIVTVISLSAFGVSATLSLADGTAGPMASLITALVGLVAVVGG